MTDLHHLKIEAVHMDGPGGLPTLMGHRVILDGKEVYCKRVELVMGLEEINVVRLDLCCKDVDIDAHVSVASAPPEGAKQAMTGCDGCGGTGEILLGVNRPEEVVKCGQCDGKGEIGMTVKCSRCENVQPLLEGQAMMPPPTCTACNLPVFV